jgi:hypothetical protein
MKYFAVILTLILLIGLISAEDLKKAPKHAKTRDELVNTFGKVIGFGPVQRAEFDRFGRQIFCVWYSPFSGRSGCFLHVYYYDPEKSEWILFIDRFIDDTADLSAEMPSYPEVLIFKNAEGKIVINESIAKLPEEKLLEKK